MLYILKANHSFENKAIYTVYESHTESILNIKHDSKSDNTIKLANTLGTSIKRHYGVRSKADKYGNKVISNNNEYFILLGRKKEDVFKMVDNQGEVVYMCEAELKESIEHSEVANCCIMHENGETVYKSIDTQNLLTSNEFIENIEKQYKQFISKTRAMGLDNSFNFKIEGKEVMLVEYTGQSDKVVIPNFITSIGAWSFAHKQIRSLKLNTGLKYIGVHAFESTFLKSLTIPESVEFMFNSLKYSGVDSDGNKLYNQDGTINGIIFKVLSNDTKIY